MTPSEFKAWFDGFTEAFSGCPTKAQWTRIKARVAEIDGKPVTHTIYMDRYWPPLITGNTAPVRTWTTTYCGAAGGGIATSSAGNLTALEFNSSQAMGDLGRAEAQSLAA